MANFIDKLSEKASKKKEELKKTLSKDASPLEQDLKRLVKEHWHELPSPSTLDRRPAYAVDGSRAVRHLANGAYLLVAQALIIGERMGERLEATDVDIQILPGAIPAPLVERFAELMMHQLEVSLASSHSDTMAKGSVIFLDGALYGQLPQLYPFRTTEEDIPESDLPNRTLQNYLHLFEMCEKRKLFLVSLAKTSHEAAHAQAWWDKAHGKEKMPKEISDSEMIYRWTDSRAGFSTPVLFGTRSFSDESRKMLLEAVQDAPAIVSFFVRLTDFDDALRVDVPASCVGYNERIGDVEKEEIIDEKKVYPILELLAADYGGFEVYNALLYSVDREVRLRQEIMDEVYLSLIQNTLGADVEVRLDRSERRFHSR